MDTSDYLCDFVGHDWWPASSRSATCRRCGLQYSVPPTSVGQWVAIIILLALAVVVAWLLWTGIAR